MAELWGTTFYDLDMKRLKPTTPTPASFLDEESRVQRDEFCNRFSVTPLTKKRFFEKRMRLFLRHILSRPVRRYEHNSKCCLFAAGLRTIRLLTSIISRYPVYK